MANYFDYTSRNELLNIYDNSQAAFFKYSYDASGNVTQRLGQRLHDTTVVTYDALNRPLICAQNGLNGANFATSRYSYGMLGNLKNTTRDEESGKGDYFTFDDLSQVTTALYSATGPSDPNPPKSVSYTLGIRNRSSMTVTDNVLHSTTTTNYNNNNNDLNQTTSITVNGTPQSVNWDNNLNLAGYNGWTYNYDSENRLISVGGSHSATFLYDGVGRCVKRVIDGATTVFTYDQWTPVAEWDGSGNLIATNVYGLGDDEIVYRLAGSTQLFYKSDPMGNVKFILDQNGNGIEKYKYDAFGSPTITDWSGNGRSSSAYGNRFMFSGRDYMIALALYDMRNRVYDPAMGRFYQTDPIGFAGDSWNLYRFCGNNPLFGGDPSGLEGEDSSFYYWSFDAGYSYYGLWDSGQSSDVSASWWPDSGDYSATPWTYYAETLASNPFGGAVSFPITVPSFSSSAAAPSNIRQNNTSPWRLGLEWLTGSGPRTQEFHDGDPMTVMLQHHSWIQATRALVAHNITTRGDLIGANDYKLKGLEGIPKYFVDYSTLFTGGLTGNLAVTYLGSYQLRYWVTNVDFYSRTASVSFQVINPSTIESATRPPLLGYNPWWHNNIGQPLNTFFSSGSLSPTNQTFSWSETIVWEQ